MSDKAAATYHPHGGLGIGAAVGEAVDVMSGNSAEPVWSIYAHMQVVGAKLAQDEAQLHSYVVNVMLKRETPGYVRVGDRHAVAVSYGKPLHADDCGRAWVSDGDHMHIVGECSDDCSTWPCAADDPDAQLAMVRVEIDVKSRPVDALAASVVHRAPGEGYGTTSCCERTPFELPRTDRLTAHEEDVTCHG